MVSRSVCVKEINFFRAAGNRQEKGAYTAPADGYKPFSAAKWQRSG